MNIINKTRNIIIEKQTKECTTILSQGIGLMFRTRIVPLLFTLKRAQRITIHSFFMLKTIDIIFLDDEKTVVDMTTLKPWTWYIPKEKVTYVIEVPEGTILSTKTGKGDELTF